jgi:hypothetical protein
VLLNTFEALAEEAGFRTAKSEITHETDFRPMLARLTRRALLAVSPPERMRERARRAAAIFKAFTVRIPDGPEIGVDIDALLGRGDSGDLSDDLSDLFVALGEAAAEHDTGVVFLLDEVQFLERAELEALIAALHQVAQRALPLTLAGAGLPQLPALTGVAKSYSERLFRFPSIGRLADDAARAALELPAQAAEVSYEPAATERILHFTDGYPYFCRSTAGTPGTSPRARRSRSRTSRSLSASCNWSLTRASSRYASAGRPKPSLTTSPRWPRSATVRTAQATSLRSSAARRRRASARYAGD